MNEYLEQLALHKESLNMAPATIKNLKLQVGHFLAWLEANGVYRPEQIQVHHLTKFQLHVSRKTGRGGMPLKPAYQNTIIWAVRQFLQYLKRERIILTDMSKHLKTVKCPKLLPKNTLNHKEMKRLLKQVDSYTDIGARDKAMLELMYSSAIRGW